MFAYIFTILTSLQGTAIFETSFFVNGILKFLFESLICLQTLSTALSIILASTTKFVTAGLKKQTRTL